MSEASAAYDGPESREKSPLDRMFHLTERKATLKGEILGGVTTFMTMAYIIFVNAAILSVAGMPAGAVMVATCLAAGFVSYSILKAVRGERKVHPLVHVIAATIVVGYTLLKVIAHFKAAA